MADREPPASVPQRFPVPGWVLVSAVLLVLVVISSFGVIYSAHKSRELFRELEQVRRAENEIQIEWRQLLLERSTLSAHARVEAMAGSELQMVPASGELRILVLE
ncbi:MAG: cell division protein FtsL [Gammaproteobacteria bacterium]|jgi:cell division protein FtsL|nr:cell division protein FtsL [Gammaproteobacteria bacterium]MBP6051693.1 cell division protein FtsL [Pseudomonadales bacterium]MBK6584702.1 cell division protein FtsL [Gammaproteobacteria bacterium]MBK7171035.1 cell division protein FtsL [Gammaproteobacteria bacterium]MBK7519789.1 cell division protein FtsL [Gammaproteobacteria bacterium]